MERSKIEKELKEKLIDSFGILSEDQIKPESKFQIDLGLDSLDTVELVFWAESNFYISIKDEDMDNVTTVKDFLDYLERTVK
jgi:acyl carrier protein